MDIKNIGVILAGGRGERFCNNVPKQFVKLNGRHVIDYVLDIFIASDCFDKIVVVIPSFDYKYIFDNYKDIDLVIGGNTRNYTVANAINYIKQNFPSCKNVIFHDSARPFINKKILIDHLSLLNQYDSVITTKKITDSLGSITQSQIPREDYFLIQTPESFKFEVLNKHFNPEDNSKTAIVQHLPLNDKVYKYFIEEYNLKITYLQDLFIGESLIKFSPFVKHNFNLKDKNVFVFGGTGGIGKALISKLESQNFYVFPIKKSDLDLSRVDFKDWERLFSDNFPDVIINVTGKYYNDSDGILEHYKDIMDVNLKANISLLDYLLKFDNKNKKINVVLISSSSASKGRENLTVYSASKVALQSIVESLSDKLSKKNIFVNIISPEKINTPLISKLHGKNFIAEELLTVDEVVDAILNYTDCNNFGEIIKIRKGFIKN